MDRRRHLEVEASVDSGLLKDHIKGRLRQFVDQYAQSSAMITDDPESTITTSRKDDILDRLRSSDDFRNWKTQVLGEEIDFIANSASSSRNLSRIVGEERSKQASAYTIENFESDFGSSMASFDDEEEGDRDDRNTSSGVSLAMTGGSSSLAFLGRNYLKHAIDLLQLPDSPTDEDVSVIGSTLRALAQLPPSDICESDDWDELRGAIRRLVNADHRLSDAILHLLIKLFNASSHRASVDALALLADHLREDIFGSKSIPCAMGEDGRLMTTPDGMDALRKLRVSDEMSCGFAKVSARYSRQHVERVAEYTLAILDPLTSTATTDGVLDPLTARALLDPKMKWWRCWMHGRLGRTAVLSALADRQTVVQRLLDLAFGSAESDLDQSDDTKRDRLDKLRTGAACRMAESLFAFDESRQLLSERIPNFAEFYPDRLLKLALMDDDQQRSKFAWRILFDSSTNAHGRTLFFDSNRLRKLGLELLNDDRTYMTKIKLLTLIDQLLKSYDDRASDMNIFDSSMDYGDGSGTFCELVMTAVSKFIVAAYSRDPDVPLSLVRACFRTTELICGFRRGRRSVSRYDQFILHAVKLVKEHSVEPECLSPILASVLSANPAVETVVKKFLCAHSNCDRILWHRPVEINDSWIRTIAERLDSLDSDGLESRTDFRHVLFSILSHPDGGKTMLRNESFVQVLLDQFTDDQFRETPRTEAIVEILEFLSRQADVLVELGRNGSFESIIADVLTKYYSTTNDGDIDGDATISYLIRTEVSSTLMEIYFRLRNIAGPNERVPLPADSMTPLMDVLNDSSRYFCSEPSRFLVRPATTSTLSLRDGNEADLIKIFIGYVERKKRIQYSEMLMEAVKDAVLEEGPSDSIERETAANSSEDIGGTDRSGIYELVLQYGKNLGVLDYESARRELASYLDRASELTKSTRSMDADWFASVLYLMFAARREKAAEFLYKFRQLEWAKCVWASCGSDFATIIARDVGPLVERIVEKESPRLLATLTLHGITVSNVITFWLNQCFLNVLDWPEICNYVVLSVIGGSKYQALFCSCLCIQLTEEICDRAYGDGDLCSLLLGPISFKLHKCISLLSQLSDKYAD